MPFKKGHPYGKRFKPGHKLGLRFGAGQKDRRTHGHTIGKEWTPTYQSWASMWARCTNPAASNYKYYGGRGIKVDESWKEFVNFLRDMGDRPKNTSLDRVNNDGNYEFYNCRWATPSEQRRNRRDYIKSCRMEA
jgi:hypothetical protein